MCGRYSIYTKPADYLTSLGVGEPVSACDPVENYNAYPTQDLPVLYRDTQNSLRCDLLHWGLIPSWSKDKSIAFKLSNARSETAADKPSFRHSFKQQRCMIPIDGYYEWVRDGKNKQPYYHHRVDNQIIWLAGLWENWVSKESGESIRSFTILTQDAVGKASDIHNRMPVFVDGSSNAGAWLDNQIHDKEVICGMMDYSIDDAIEIYPVSKDMNSPKNNSRVCIDVV